MSIRDNFYGGLLSPDVSQSTSSPTTVNIGGSADISKSMREAAEAGRNFTPGRTSAATGYAESSDATDTLAQLTRDQWDYYKQVGFPLEDSLYSSYRNKGLWNEEVQTAGDASDAQYRNAMSNIQREQGRYGVNMSNRQTDATERRLGLSAAAAKVANRNDARKMMQETDNATMTGGSTQSVTLKSLME
jgi:hypothetical protein